MSSSNMRVPSPLPALRAVNQLSSLFQPVLQRSLNSQYDMVTFSFPFWHFFWGWKFPMSSGRSCDSVAILVQRAHWRFFKLPAAVWAKRGCLLIFFFCHKLCFKSPHSSPLLPHVGQQGYLARLVSIKVLGGEREYFMLWFTHWARSGQMLF